MTWTNQEEEGEDRGRIMMMPPKWFPCVPRTSQKYPLVDMDICLFFLPHPWPLLWLPFDIWG